MHQEPLACAVTVRLTAKLDEDVYGECHFDPEKQTIKIKVARELPLVAQLDALVHEWAHAMLGPLSGEFHQHGPLWGVCYARCYSAVYAP